MKYRCYTHADFVFTEYIEAESEEQARKIHEDHLAMSDASEWDYCDDIETTIESY